MKEELKDLAILSFINIMMFGLWYFTKYHLNFDYIQTFPIEFILMLGILSLGGVLYSISYNIFEYYKSTKYGG